jgi:hypothetical protein
MWRERLARVAKRPVRTALELGVVAASLYLLGAWLHIPYGGGHVYSDIVTVFQNRFDSVSFSIHNLPYVNTFVEYPPLTAYFIYIMGVLGAYVPLSPGLGLLDNYYVYSTIFLSIPTFLMIPELLKICEILGVRRMGRRTLLFYVATPSFMIMILVNWYIIGVYLATLGLRKYLQGSRWASGVLFGVSAGSNLVTAAPALGLLVTAEKWRERVIFAFAVLATYLVINLPFIAANRALWLSFWSYQAGWYIEGSWMLAFLTNESPLRHYIFPALFVALFAAVLVAYLKQRKQAVTARQKAMLAVKVSLLLTLAYLFSTYVFTPQLNLLLLPFFVFAPISRRYWEFLAFESVNALVILWGFSQPLLVFGINIPTPVLFASVWVSPIQALAVLRSLWVGKFLIYDGLIKQRSFLKPEKPVQRQTTLDAGWLTPRARQHDGGSESKDQPPT